MKTRQSTWPTTLPETELLANGKPLEKVNDFEYLGSWVDNPAKDIKIRNAQAWSALRRLDNIWKSNLPRKLKINFFRATVENILLYGAETWTITKILNNELDGTYTCLLRYALNIDWKHHISNEELYVDLPKVFSVIRKRRLRLAGHCWRSNETAAMLLLWKPKHSHKDPGRPKLDYVTLLSRDTELNPSELSAGMSNRDIWKSFVMGSGAPD